MRAFLLALFATLSASALVTVPQDRGEGHFTSAVSLVVLNVTVTDGRGRHVSGLKADDFQVQEDRRLQDITLFDAGDAPASVGLIIDNSGSMSDKRADVAAAALGFVAASNANDEIFVVGFNEQVFLSLPPAIRFTADVGRIRAALVRTVPTGLTALYDAIALGIEHVATGTRDRKALVVLSDGGDNASVRRLDDVLQMAQRSSATIYTIGIYDETDLDSRPRVLRRIADTTGGRAYFPESLHDLGRVWSEIAGGIRQQYTIGYASGNPARDGRFRAVTVTMNRRLGRNLRVTTREGYRAPTAAETAK